MPSIDENHFLQFVPKEVQAGHGSLEDAFYLPGFLCKEQDSSLFQQLQKDQRGWDGLQGQHVRVLDAGICPRSTLSCGREVVAMPQVMDDITNIAGGGAKKQSRQKLEFEGKENQVPTAPIQKDLDSCGQGAADQASAPKQQQPAKHEVTTRRVVETGEPKSEKAGSRRVWELMRDASRDLVECWAKSAKGTFHPWMQNSLAKLGRLAGPLGPRLQSGLQRGPPGMPPPPPPVPDWADLNILRPSATLHACHDPDLTALELQELGPDAEDEGVFGRNERQRSLLWLSQVCTLHALDDCVFHDSVMLLDRYDELCRFMALFGIARKVQGAAGGGSNYAPGYLTRNLGPEKFARVLAAELEVLKALDFQTAWAGHTALDFLESFVYSLERNGGPPDMRPSNSPLKCVATFLLQLALGDAHLLHRYPYAILSAGAVYDAAGGLKSTPRLEEQLLIAHGGDVLRRNRRGQRPSDLVRTAGHSACEAGEEEFWTSQERRRLEEAGLPHVKSHSLSVAGRRSGQDTNPASPMCLNTLSDFQDPHVPEIKGLEEWKETKVTTHLELEFKRRSGAKSVERDGWGGGEQRQTKRRDCVVRFLKRHDFSDVNKPRIKRFFSMPFTEKTLALAIICIFQDKLPW
eukprot:g24290.t1